MNFYNSINLDAINTWHSNSISIWEEPHKLSWIMRGGKTTISNSIHAETYAAFLFVFKNTSKLNSTPRLKYWLFKILGDVECEGKFYYNRSIRVPYYGAFAKMNASFFSFLPAQREKSCVSRLYFLPQNKKVNTDETAAPHSTLLSLFLLLFFNSFSYRSIVCVLSNCPAELSNWTTPMP